MLLGSLKSLNKVITLRNWIPSLSSVSRTTVTRQPYANYYTHQKVSDDENKVVVDLRTDTLTEPDSEMRNAMVNAKIGDDVLDEDPTVKELERTAAAMLGKEAGLYVLSGTMGNLLSVMCHCNHRGEEMLLGDQSHIFIHEQGGAAFLGGIHPRPVTNLPDGTFDLQELEEKIRPDGDFHAPKTKLICLENSHNRCGGAVLSKKFLDDVGFIAKTHNIAVHMDGARLMNAALASKRDAADILQHCDTVSLCLSKGLGAPVGSVIAGPQTFIDSARRLRKALGGGIRQGGILAAAGLIALDSGVKRLHIDHANAKYLATGLANLKHPLLSVDVDNTETNLVYLKINGAKPETVLNMVNQITENEKEKLGHGIQIKAFPSSKDKIRLVAYKHITTELIDLAVKKFEYIANVLSESPEGK
ncbi:uncharacterized protein LOC102802143 [Saccoglossus kowalevskii]|uniref:Uncharacterized protein R102.4-like n=1 Tax=Saccoglossus kowalevskii TaxID=10224 RepID=A0ABM0M3V6_SACKO|nr:PREDICTED: uncharacterized protein R102.4-like [Saccoglossus kowalevskii]